MELSKYQNHRNVAYLNWLRRQKCIISSEKAECVHHMRIGTNGGTALKPSDYFCVPLIHEFHTQGSLAIHRIGETSFSEHFKIDSLKLFILFLKKYILEELNKNVKLDNEKPTDLIFFLIQLIEENRKAPKLKKIKKKSRKDSSHTKKSMTENPFYQNLKEQKREKDKKIRYNFKEQKRIRDKKLREMMKSSREEKQLKFSQTEYYQRAKEYKKLKDKEFRDKMKKQKKLQNSNDL